MCRVFTVKHLIQTAVWVMAAAGVLSALAKEQASVTWEVLVVKLVGQEEQTARDGKLEAAKVEEAGGEAPPLSPSPYSAASNGYATNS